MSFAIVIGMAVLVLIFIMFFTNIGSDYAKRTDQQLLDLWPLHENNVRAAKVVGQEAHKKALDKMATLTNEMKKRGLLKVDFTQENEALDSMSRKLFSRGLDEIKSLAKSNDAKALYQLGMIFHSAKEMDTSIQYISDSANLGYTDAQYALGWAFTTEGNGVTRNACEAMKWLKIAATQGHFEAQKALDVALKSFSKTEADTAFAQADKWLASKRKIAVNESEQLTKGGSTQAQVVHGETHIESTRVQKDHQKDATLFLKAAEQGRASAQSHLAAMYMQGKGVSQDYAKAAQWFRKAADQGYADAQNALGVMYSEGQGVAQDYQLAATWISKAAEQDHSQAQYTLGMMYVSGQGVTQNDQQATGWLRKAAEKGLPKAQLYLGVMYATGKGVPQDETKAIWWLQKAADQGNTKAETYLFGLRLK